MSATCEVIERWPTLASCPPAAEWLAVESRLGLAPRTIDAYGRAIVDFLAVCARRGVDPLSATRAGVSVFVADMRERDVVAAPKRRAASAGLSNATIQLRLVALRLFFDHLVAEGVRATNPVGRGSLRAGAESRGLVAREHRQTWIPSDEQWRSLLRQVCDESIRTRTMFAFAYDAGLRREELCRLDTGDLDPAHRSVRVRAETTKSGRGRTVVYSASTACC